MNQKAPFGGCRAAANVFGPTRELARERQWRDVHLGPRPCPYKVNQPPKEASWLISPRLQPGAPDETLPSAPDIASLLHLCGCEALTTGSQTGLTGRHWAKGRT